MPRLFVEEEGNRRIVPVGADPVVVGRAVENQIVIRDRKSSRKHCRFVRVDEQVVLEDMNSSNGTLLNGEPASQKGLAHGDLVNIGEVAITFVADGKNGPWGENGSVESAPVAAPAAAPTVVEESASDEDEGGLLEEPDAGEAAATQSTQPYLVIENGPRAGDQVEITATPFTIGRKQQNGLALPDNRVSGVHCQVVQEASRWFIQDLDSGNGVVIGKQRVNRHPLRNGEQAMIGSTQVRFEGLPAEVIPGGASPSTIIRKVDSFDISEEDISRIQVHEPPASPLQFVWTGLFVVLFAGILYLSWNVVDETWSARVVPLDPDNLVRNNPSFESGESGAIPGWKVDEAGDSASLALVSDGAPHGQQALELSGGGGDRGFVRMLQSEPQRITDEDDLGVFTLRGQLRNVSFATAGIEILWLFDNGEVRRVVAESTELTERTSHFKQLRVSATPPDWANVTHYQVGVIAQGRGTVEVDDLVLKRRDSKDDDPKPLTVAANERSDSVRVAIGDHGVFPMWRGRHLKIRSARFATDRESELPFGQVLAYSEDPMAERENGIRSGIFQYRCGKEPIQVEQQIQPVSGQIRAAWRVLNAGSGAAPAIVMELDSAVAREDDMTVYQGGQPLPVRTFRELDGVEGDEWVIGVRQKQLVIQVSVPVSFSILPDEQTRGAPTVMLRAAPDTELIELFLSEVSDREQRRRAGGLEEVRGDMRRNQFAAALTRLQELEDAFGHDDEVRATVRSLRGEIEKVGEARLAQLRAIRSDLDRLPRSPIRGVFLEEGEALARAFDGTEYGRAAAEMVGQLEEGVRREGTERARSTATELLLRGKEHYSRDRLALARFYFEWIGDEFAGTSEARDAQAMLNRLEARE